MWRRLAMMMTLCGALLATSITFAQQKAAGGGAGNAPAAAGDATPKQATGQSVSAQSYWFEWALVIVMTGAALYAVCRGSRRNM